MGLFSKKRPGILSHRLHEEDSDTFAARTPPGELLLCVFNLAHCAELLSQHGLNLATFFLPQVVQLLATRIDVVPLPETGREGLRGTERRRGSISEGESDLVALRPPCIPLIKMLWC